MRTLYFGYISPYSRRIRVVLAEKGLEYTEEVLQFAAAPASYNAINPCRRVPVLTDGDVTLFESNIMIEYLLTTYPDASAGDGDGDPPLATTMTREAHHWDDSLTLNAIETMQDSGLMLLQMRNNGITAEQSEFLGRERSRIDVILDYLEARATPEGFIPGVMSIQDLNLVIALQWAAYRDIFDWVGRPTLAAILARYESRPSLASTGPELAPA